MMGVRRYFHEKSLYRVIGGAALAGIVLFGLGNFLGIWEISWPHLAALAGMLAFLACLNFLPPRGKLLCLLAAAAALVLLWYGAGPERGLAFVQTYVRWCLGEDSREPGWVLGFQLLQTCIVTAVSYFLQILIEKVRLIRRGLAFICAAGLVIGMLAGWRISHVGVAFVLLYILFVCAEWVQERWEKKRSGSVQQQMLWLSPFLILFLLLLLLTPAPEAPFAWRGVRTLYAQLREAFQTVSWSLFPGNGDEFSSSLSGFSESGTLGNGFWQDDRRMMTLQGREDLVTNVYLTGKTFDHFDGRQWIQVNRGGEKERFIDTMETLYGIRRLEPEYWGDYLKGTKLWIRFEDMSTNYVFAPMKVAGLGGVGSALEFDSEGTELLWKKRRGYGTEYEVNYYQMNLGLEILDRLLGERPEPDEGLWDEVARQYQGQLGRRMTWEELEEYRWQEKETYLEEVSLSQEVREYLEDLLDGASTEMEKLRALERELRSFSYNADPGGIPREVEDPEAFLDYFLLEKREGYCTYFATAFVLLARSQGIPARYVQGYCVPIFSSGELVSSQEAIAFGTGGGRALRQARVSSGMAHSWPEVYLEGVGWIPFEPTPGYESLRYTPWQVKEHEEKPSEEGAVVEGEEGFPGEAEPDAEEEPEEEPEEVPEEEEPAEEGWKPGRLLGLLLEGILLVLAGLLLALGLDGLLGRFRYRNMTEAGRLRVEVSRNLSVLARLGVKRQDWETFQELQEKLGKEVPDLADLHFLKDYEAVIYGDGEVRSELTEAVRLERKLLLAQFLKKKRLGSYCLWLWCRMSMLHVPKEKG